MKLKSNRRYILQSLRDWLNDQDKTPFLIADASLDGVVVPDGFAQSDGRICLDISTNMVRNFELTETMLSFDAQFKGKVHRLKLPLNALLSLACKENGWSIWFSVFDGNEHVDLPLEPPRFTIEEDD